MGFEGVQILLYCTPKPNSNHVFCALHPTRTASMATCIPIVGVTAGFILSVIFMLTTKPQAISCMVSVFKLGLDIYTV